MKECNNGPCLYAISITSYKTKTKLQKQVNRDIKKNHEYQGIKNSKINRNKKLNNSKDTRKQHKDK